jgi:3-hydroxyisobutyrate dehydrogenase-like beta-hydroxyacid dehydrogenase
VPVTGAIAVLHPGAMGSRVAGELVDAGHEVRWLATGRSAQTRQRATHEGLVEAASAQQLVRGAEIVISVCPPQGAVDVARLVASEGFAGTYVDANPVSPLSLSDIAAAVGSAGATLVDAGIVGPPPRAAGRTNVYLSGAPDHVAAVAEMISPTVMTAVDVGPRVGAASAAKQAYALYNKGRLALALMAGELAAAHGVSHVLSAESGRPGADALDDVDALRSALAETAWRWGPEFDEIAATLAAAGLDASLASSVAARWHRLGPPTQP